MDVIGIAAQAMFTFTVSGFSTGSTSGRFTAIASESLLINTHSNFSSDDALIS
jgi:hypothetical protein